MTERLLALIALLAVVTSACTRSSSSGSNPVDQNGIATFYDDGSGQYFSLLRSGTKGAILVCRSTSAVEAASRACESPLSRVAPSWQLSLGG